MPDSHRPANGLSQQQQMRLAQIRERKARLAFGGGRPQVDVKRLPGHGHRTPRAR